MSTPTLHLVIEGIGTVVRKYYSEPLKRTYDKYKPQIRITFVDERKYWQGKSNAKDFLEFIKGIKSWATYINKSTASGRARYNQLCADVVFIATPDSTHIDPIAKHWLSNGERCKQIFIEKPIDASLDRARDLLAIIREDDPKVRALDHYRARMIPIIGSPLQFKHILRDLGGRITGFTFYFLEDGSLCEESTGVFHSIDPIEGEGRAESLQHGLILDMMPHVPAVLSSFGIVDTVRVLGVRAGRYTYTGKDGKKHKACIRGETFAHVRFSFRGFDLFPIRGEAFIGKGIKGSTSLKMEGNIKLLFLEGKNGKKYRFDLRGSEGGGKVTLVDKNGEQHLIDLYPDAYGTIIRLIAENKFEGLNLPLFFDMPVELAKNIRLAIEEMRHPFKKVKSLPAYHISAPNDGESGAPTLESVRKLVPIQPFLDTNMQTVDF